MQFDRINLRELVSQMLVILYNIHDLYVCTPCMWYMVKLDDNDLLRFPALYKIFISAGGEANCSSNWASEAGGRGGRASSQNSTRSLSKLGSSEQ